MTLGRNFPDDFERKTCKSGRSPYSGEDRGRGPVSHVGTRPPSGGEALCYNFPSLLRREIVEVVKSMMVSFGRKLSLMAAVAALSVLVVTPGCTGFFVNQPDSVTIIPNAPSLTPGDTQSFMAQAAYSNNSSVKDVTKSATWTTSDTCVVAIINSGANSGNATDVGTGGSATVTASYSGVTGTATASVPTGLTINPCPEQVVGNFLQVVYNVGSQPVTFVANGSSGGVSWISDNPSAVSINASTGQATFPAAGPANITATAGTETATMHIVVQ